MGIIINGQNDTIRATDGTGTVELNVTGDVTGTATTATSSQSVVDSDGNIRISSNESGMIISGIATVQTGKLMVGEAYVDATAVGMGSTTTAGRDAGIGTFVGSMIYNVTVGSVQIYKETKGWVSIDDTGDVLQGMTATGGIINDQQIGDKLYRIHTFESTGTFDVTAIGEGYPSSSEVEYLVVAGGGGGGLGGDSSITSHQAGGGGGGAGGLLTTDPASPASQSTLPVSVQSYAITVGAGGAGGNSFSLYHKTGDKGSDSTFSTITADGGGGGVGDQTTNPVPALKPGGSGGGGAGFSNPADFKVGGAATNYPGPTQQGHPGGDGSGNPESPDQRHGGGGGGAGGIGNPGGPSTPAPTRGVGGLGLTLSISGTSIGYAGGGSAGRYSPSSPSTIAGPSIGGGGTGKVSGDGGAGQQSRGAGGGGAHSSTVNASNVYQGGQGGSGIVVIRYEINSSQSGTAKATGGNISFYNGKTIHVFNNTADFTVTSPISGAEFVLIGGGGAGGSGRSPTSWASGAGGGAGGVVVHNGPIAFSPGPHAVTVGAGGAPLYRAASGNPGTSSTLVVPSVDTYSAFRGGAGGQGYPGIAGDPGGSGGGGATPSSGGSAENPAANPGATEFGSAGGDSSGFGSYPSAGGGGAGAVGEDGGGGTPTVGGRGGIGMQLPATYRDPKQEIGLPGPGGGAYWVAGGGGGGVYVATMTGGEGGSWNGTTSVPGGPFSGGGQGTSHGDSNQPDNINGGAGTGGGGGGAAMAPNSFNTVGGRGGSGIVIIAYPT